MTGIRIAAGIALAACIASSVPANAANDGPPIDRVDLSAQISHANTQLEITWSVTNRGDHTLFVLTRPLRHNLEARDETVYVGSSDTGEIAFALRAFPIPNGVHPTALDRIGAVPLEPGQRVEGKASAPLPLTVNLPYQQPIRLRPDLRQARFCLGFLRAAPNLPGSSRLPDGAVAFYHEAMTTSVQTVGCSQPMALPIPRASWVLNGSLSGNR